MAIAKHRPSRIVINETAIYQNIVNEKARLTDGTDLFMVVKANAYGHGLIQVAAIAVRAGATGFCVAVLDEALALREAGFTQPILVLGITESQNAALLAINHISATVCSLAWLKNASRFLDAAHVKLPLAVHLGLDTGMGRIGFQTPTELSLALAYLKTTKQFKFEGIFTHFSKADSTETGYFEKQLKRWCAFMTVVTNRPKYVHVSNTATSLWHDTCNGNLIRFGVGGYGLNPSGVDLEAPFVLQPAMRLESRTVFVKLLKAGQSVSYGATYTAQEDEWVATVPIGYADGYRRQLQGFHVLVDGHFCEIIGRICMDQLMIRLPRQYSVGTLVTLVGKDHGQSISLQAIADYCGTIHYEIACGFTDRLPRVYQN
ncbi:alanine racemase [Secundilactobacillus pentosiphilus]|uniref:Alanine racemase n=1 Tax=Secundilactobacillus pentosiphilus TaxID=1714682 RepID=A0A1Z5IWH6_9LACO|nr:alanine racemase [Secundilactobacillus pentosiphilus]GAX06097.1 alanine racemase [Secundilactobacillus pentosiphilus]